MVSAVCQVINGPAGQELFDLQLLGGYIKAKQMYQFPNEKIPRPLRRPWIFVKTRKKDLRAESYRSGGSAFNFESAPLAKSGRFELGDLCHGALLRAAEGKRRI